MNDSLRPQKAPTEALFRSMLLVLLDNGSAEYSFIVKFFREPQELAAPAIPLKSPTFSPTDRSASASSTQLRFDHDQPPGSESDALGESMENAAPTLDKEQRTALDGIWKQIMNPAVQYCQARLSTLVLDTTYLT